MDDLVKQRIAIIPARGGSKRLPGKNIMDFFGKPMIAWTIQAAIDSKLFDIVMVSTDSQEIAEVSKAYGAQVPFFRDSFSDDYSPVSEATLTALYQMEEYTGKNFDSVVQLMANCPIRNSDTIVNQVKLFESRINRPSLLSGFKYGMFNPWWAHYKGEDGNMHLLYKNSDINTRSQDLPNLFCPSGSIWVSQVELLKKHKTFYSPSYDFYEMSWQEAIDIDDEDDLNLAKAVYLLRNELL